MNRKERALVGETKEAALRVLLHNARGPRHGLPRAAGWGYPEPYTRDLMIGALGILASGNAELTASLRAVLLAAAGSQTERGHIPSLVDDPLDRGASDTTPLFLLAVALFRRATGEARFLEPAVRKAMTWMSYQSPGDRSLVAQLPTSDWRDEQWALGYGLYVNAVVYSYLRLFGSRERAEALSREVAMKVVEGEAQRRHVPEGLALSGRPYFAFWSYKVYSSDRFDLLGNCLAALSGLAPPRRARALIRWVERECDALRARRELSGELPPCFFPYIRPGESDWRPRYRRYNRPGEYHNGGVWPFVCGFYVAAAVAAGAHRLAERKLLALGELNRLCADPGRIARFDAAGYGFNEWIKAQDGRPRGQDWQSWSAAMYLYAAACVERGRALFFD